VNVRIDTQPPGYGSEPHLDFIVTDLDGMLAQLCGPDRKIIRLRDKRGIYLFLIEITAITKYLAAPTADPGEFCGVGQTAGAEFPKYAGIYTPRCFVQTDAAVGPGLGALVYAGLYAVLPEAIAWRALFAAPTSLSPRPAANDAAPGPRPSLAEPCFPVRLSHDLGSL